MPIPTPPAALDPEIVARIRGALVVVDARTVVALWDGGAEALYGYAAAEAVGRPLADLTVPLGSVAATTDLVHRALADGRAFQDSTRTRKDGTTLAVTVSAHRLGGPGATRVALGERDVLDAIRDADDRVRRLVASSPSVLYSLRVGAGVQEGILKPGWLSDNVDRLTGFTREEALDPAWWPSQVHADDLPGVLAGIATVLDAGTVAREYRLRHKDGSYRWIRDEQLLVVHPGGAREVVGSWSDVTARKVAEMRLAESEEEYRLLFDANPVPMSVIDRETLAVLAVNDAAVRGYGYSREEFLSMTVADVRDPEARSTTAADYAGVEASDRQFVRSRHRRKDGTVMDVEITGSRFTFRGRPAWLHVLADVTDRKSLESQLVRAQKMEAVGQLAGGVAHDFNNLLGVIRGHAGLLSRDLPAGSREQGRAAEINQACDRAAALTRQLLAFGRRQVLQPEVLDLEAVVRDVARMLGRLIREDVQLIVKSGPTRGRVRADAGQLEQVILNLAVNARDAMPDGGRLVIQTADATVDDVYVRAHPSARKGDYVVLSVADNGQGMDPATQARIFEPFFTTKPEGKGTGLGLSTVYGIVRQSGGWVTVYSEPGHGTTFRVYLPRAAGEPGPREVSVAAPPPAGGGETILVVEDAEALRLLIRELLEGAGYAVLDANGPHEALALLQSAPRVDLVLTDMVMPRMSGQELARQVQAARPGARVVFMSGYSDPAAADEGVLAPGAPFLQKPFTMDDLMRTVRRALDALGPKMGETPAP